MAARPGLRERKKLKTREAIQTAAMALFREHGYQRTTIEQIAAAAEISPATFFNYFPSKEDAVLQDDLDPIIIAAFRAQPADLGPIPALRNALRETFTNITGEQAALQRQRQELILGEPDLRAAMLNQFAGLVQEVSELIAGRVGRPIGDFKVRNLAGALIGVIISGMLAAQADPTADMMELMDAGIAHLEAGLPI